MSWDMFLPVSPEINISLYPPSNRKAKGGRIGEKSSFNRSLAPLPALVDHVKRKIAPHAPKEDTARMLAMFTGPTETVAALPPISRVALTGKRVEATAGFIRQVPSLSNRKPASSMNYSV
jgi:hypothetical protein